MPRRRILGALVLLAGVCVFVLPRRSIAWMAYGGVRAFVQPGLLVPGVVAGGGGVWMLCGGRGGPTKLPTGGGDA